MDFQSYFQDKEAAVCFLVFPLRCVFAPLNPAFTVPEIEFEFQDLPCHTVVVMDGEDNSATLQVAGEQKVQVLEMQRNSKIAGLFSLRLHEQSPVKLEQPLPAVERQSGRDDVALVLHTSGTTKKPKIVPLTHENLTVGALCIKSTLCRQKSDVCLNLMPLYHIHGLSVNVLASAMSGSSVVCTPGYKGPEKPTEWLASGAGLSSSEFSASGAGVGLIRNCSAALVPVLADKMEQLFQCVVMPTYAMSESYIDENNYLCLSGRYKEIINRGGEKISPFEVTSWDATSGLPAPIGTAEVAVKTVPWRLRVCFCQKIHMFGEICWNVVQEMALMETMYGFSILFITLAHVFFDTYELTHGKNDYTSPFRPQQDTWQLAHLLAVNMKPVTLFLVCYGYLESQHRGFLFGGFEREILLLLVTVFHQLLQSLFIIAWEMLADRSAPSGYAGVNKTNVAESLRFGLTQNPDWFIQFILFGRIFMLLNHKLGIPGWLQMLFCLAVRVFEILGRYALGAYLFNRVTFVFLRDYGILLFGVMVFPSLTSFAQAFIGEAGKFFRDSETTHGQQK
eukprot:Skav216581  [mRNA]  locus=scaffold22:30735:38835:+ [translate_table: standard]